jgi:RNA polymerase sigma-70 factor (ECF subfamily)
MIRLVHKHPAEPLPRPDTRPADELADVARAASQGDRSAAHALLVALAPHLLRTVRSVLGRDDADVEDVAQEAALVVLDALPGFRGESSVVRFATRTAVLVAMNARRKRTATKRGSNLTASAVDLDALAGRREGPEQELARARAIDAVRALLLTLPAAQAEALGLHCIGGCTLAEIAQATNAPLQTVKSRLRLARQALRQLLDREPSRLEGLESDE